jgi:hypothetical protein
MDRFIVSITILVVIGALSLAVFGSMAILEKEQECREKGGIPERGICLHPSAVIK